jgi:hypothetical protein
MLRVSTQSKEYVKVPVSAKKSGVAFDPSVDVVKMAFSSSEHLGAAPTWQNATWESGAGQYWARCVVGPGGTVQLAAGTWWVFVQITDSPEIPVVGAGPIEVY